jgi:hypothetical protein
LTKITIKTEAAMGGGESFIYFNAYFPPLKRQVPMSEMKMNSFDTFQRIIGGEKTNSNFPND